MTAIAAVGKAGSVPVRSRRARPRPGCGRCTARSRTASAASLTMRRHILAVGVVEPLLGRELWAAARRPRPAASPTGAARSASSAWRPSRALGRAADRWPPASGPPLRCRAVPAAAGPARSPGRRAARRPSRAASRSACACPACHPSSGSRGRSAGWRAEQEAKTQPGDGLTRTTRSGRRVSRPAARCQALL